MKHWGKQEKSLSRLTRQTSTALSSLAKKFLEAHRSINSAEATTENNDSFSGRLVCHSSDHRAVSVTKPLMKL